MTGHNLPPGCDYKDIPGYDEPDDMPEIDDRDRLRTIIIDQQEILLLCREPKGEYLKIPTRIGLPKDAHVQGVYYTAVRKGFYVVIHSKEFEPVPPGAEIPPLTAQFQDFIFKRVNPTPTSDEI